MIRGRKGPALGQREVRLTDDLDLLLAVMPPEVRQAIEGQPGGDEILEVVLDLGRIPEARFPGRAVDLLPRPVGGDLAQLD